MKIRKLRGGKSAKAEAQILNFRSQIVVSLSKNDDPKRIVESLQENYNQLLNNFSSEYIAQDEVAKRLTYSAALLDLYINLFASLKLEERDSTNNPLDLIGYCSKIINQKDIDPAMGLEVKWIKTEAQRATGQHVASLATLKEMSHDLKNTTNIRVIDFESKREVLLGSVLEQKSSQLKALINKQKVRVIILNASDPAINDYAADMKKKLVKAGYNPANIQAQDHRDKVSIVYAYYRPEFKSQLNVILKILYPEKNTNNSGFFDKTSTTKGITNSSIKERFKDGSVDIIIRIPGKF